YGRRVGCTRCNQRWSVTSGTVMADTKLPLTHWFRAMHLMTSTKQGISAIELGRRLGVSYPTAWYLPSHLSPARNPNRSPYFHCVSGLLSAGHAETAAEDAGARLDGE